jgi:hypothetical protein
MYIHWDEFHSYFCRSTTKHLNLSLITRRGFDANRITDVNNMRALSCSFCADHKLD